MNKTLTKYFGKTSLMRIWHSGIEDFTEIPEDQRLKLHAICEIRPDNLEEAYNFFGLPDLLFRSIYDEVGTENGEKLYLYPFIQGAAIPDHIEEVVGPIGTQTSKYHQESLKDHIALVAKNLFDAGLSGTLATQLAVMHDLGKKYTSATNKVGQVCFYNHAAISALIAKYWLRGTASQTTVKYIVATIYAHMLPYTDWQRTTDFRTGLPRDFRHEFELQLKDFYDGHPGDIQRTMELIDLLAKCDEGIQEITPEYEQKIASGREIIHQFRHGA